MLAFSGWKRQFPATIGVNSVILPGRDARQVEPFYTSFAHLIEDLTDEIFPLLSKPFVFFGHSFGALVAFELARALENRGKRAMLLCVSAHRPPRTPLMCSPLHMLEEGLFIEKILDYGGTPSSIFTEPILKNIYLPLLRADFTLWETYCYSPGPLLHCPISIFGGLEDHTVDTANLNLWEEETIQPCSLQLFKGNHFFLKDCQSELISTLTQQIKNNLEIREQK